MWKPHSYKTEVLWSLLDCNFQSIVNVTCSIRETQGCPYPANLLAVEFLPLESLV